MAGRRKRAKAADVMSYLGPLYGPVKWEPRYNPAKSWSIRFFPSIRRYKLRARVPEPDAYIRDSGQDSGRACGGY